MGAGGVSRLAGVVLLMTTIGGGSADAAEATVSGTALYRERIALPPDAVLEATLEDVSRADARAEVLGRARVAPAGQVPIAFEIGYDPARIDPAHRYAVRAGIRVDDRLWFTTTEAHLVLTGGRGDQVELMLRRVSETVGKPAPGALGQLPATFTGDLPCADCAGIRYQLDLFPDQAFYLRQTYLGRGPDHAFDLIGSFLIAADGRTLLLYGGREAPLQFRIESPDRLRQLDLEGRKILSELNYDLTRQAGLSPIEPHLAMRGMYRYLADAGLFTECLTGQRLPVAQEAGNAALERAYGEARRQPGEELLATLEGRIAQRPKVEGEGREPTLVVERVTGIWPGETCGARFDTAPLENSYWKLTRLQDQPVLVAGQQREPYLILRPQDHRVAGSGGCNRLVGSYQVEGGSLTFGQIAGTMMACPDGMATERTFLAALGRSEASGSWGSTSSCSTPAAPGSPAWSAG